jgi:PAS domain S-box-containing protein
MTGKPSAWARSRSYRLAIAAAILGLLISVSLEALLGYPSFLILVPAVIFATIAGGATSGVTTTVLTVLGMMWIMPPAGSLAVAATADVARIFAFLGVAAISIAVGHRQHRLADALQSSEAEFRGIFELAGAGLAVAEPGDARMIRVNAAFCELTGYSEQELLAMTAVDLTHPDDRDADITAVRRVIRGTAGTWRSEKRYVRKDGRVIWVLVHGSAIRNAAGRTLFTVANVVDITNRKEAEERLTSANQVKDEFLATLSHELRTPVNVIVGWSRMLSSEFRDREHIERGLRVITRNADVASNVIEDLISVSSIITGRMRLTAEPIDLGEILRGVIESVSVAATTRRIRLTADLQPVPAITGDRIRVSQVAWNLLSNALKFTPADGRIQVTLGVEDDQVVLRVIDTGVGIDPDFLPHIFEKFSQENTSSTREHAGLGLGLTIVKQLVELHGGTIAAHSEGRDRGAAFTARFPALTASSVTTVGRLFDAIGT